MAKCTITITDVLDDLIHHPTGEVTVSLVFEPPIGPGEKLTSAQLEASKILDGIHASGDVTDSRCTHPDGTVTDNLRDRENLDGVDAIAHREGLDR
jgi:hypothetical protein